MLKNTSGRTRVHIGPGGERGDAKDASELIERVRAFAKRNGFTVQDPTMMQNYADFPVSTNLNYTRDFSVDIEANFPGTIFRSTERVLAVPYTAHSGASTRISILPKHMSFFDVVVRCALVVILVFYVLLS